MSSEHRTAATSVAQYLSQKGENPKEFFANVESSSDGNVLVFHLWHQSAFEPQYRGADGNPGGKNRDVWFDVTAGKVVKMLYWQ
jgi:hypothetical protein